MRVPAPEQYQVLVYQAAPPVASRRPPGCCVVNGRNGQGPQAVAIRAAAAVAAASCPGSATTRTPAVPMNFRPVSA
ncbi:hypothetical protein C882_0686 [Caenispirillum salinarum AK4]|uniref:Uncharacterized protein n=1 Tax=Caenispirillum salinarum AK4 TaxID=1238182 RepID=K9GUN0_9PROT|nr:hypothetical protein C882_0686 [Caenispirillum salinarum AK4]